MRKSREFIIKNGKHVFDGKILCDVGDLVKFCKSKPYFCLVRELNKMEEIAYFNLMIEEGGWSYEWSKDWFSSSRRVGGKRIAGADIQREMRPFCARN